MTTTLTPRDYQMNAVTTICNLHRYRRNSRIVLAAATGSGKTEMSIMIIENFIRRRLGRVLVITHHTNIIKSNFIERLNSIKPNFSYSDTNTDVDCYIAIRSTSLNRIDINDFDLLVVDEAHQNYFAKTIQSFANSIAHQVLLTATPSKFVSAGFDILPIARLDIPNEFFASLSFRVVNAETSITTDSYNADNVVKSDVKFHQNEVKSMVDSVIPFIDDNKKLFICKDILQAQATADYLNTLGIVTKVTDSQSDPDSVIANQFKSGDFNSLCVVDRMRVGYSDTNLYHTIDMSFTHNPDVIMQILSRSNRGNQSQSKTYIKVTNNALNLRTRFMLSVSTSLFRSDNLLAYDGNNTSNLKIAVNKNVTINKSSAKSEATDNWFIPDNIDVIDFFSNCDFVDSDTIISALSNNIDYDYCVNVAKNYATYNDFKVGNSGCYQFIRRNNLIDKFIADTRFIKRSKNTIDYSTFTDDELNAVRLSYSSAKLFANSNKNAYNECKKRGIKPTYNRHCECCNTTFVAVAASKYCPDCKKSIVSAQQKQYKLNRKINKNS